MLEPLLGSPVRLRKLDLRLFVLPEYCPTSWTGRRILRRSAVIRDIPAGGTEGEAMLAIRTARPSR